MDNNKAFNDFKCTLQTAKLTDEEREELEGYSETMVSQQNATVASLI